MSRFSVVALHFTRECNLNCPFCYRPKDTTGNEKPFQFFIDCVQYIKEIAPQIALGGGEPLLFPGFIKDFGAECKKRGVMLNVTTNGKKLLEMNVIDIRDIIKDVTMVSVSLDRSKWDGLFEYGVATRHLRAAKPTGLIGTNLLLQDYLFNDKGKPLFMTINWLLTEARVDRVFLLHPKNFALGIDIRAFEGLLRATSTVFPNKVFTDDLTRQILDHGYPPWNVPCHFGKDILSIDEEGGAHGCSFEQDALFKLEQPDDILKARDVVTGDRFSCPFLVINA